MHHWLKRPLVFVSGLLCLIVATLCFGWGVITVSESRQMERLALTPVAALASGPYAVSGALLRDGQVLIAPYSNQPVLYVRYLLEEEYRDSDGKLRTRNLDLDQRSTRFLLTDNSGTVTVDPTLSTSRTDWAINQTYRKREGDLIYSEWTLSEGQEVELLGRFQQYDETLVFHKLPANLPPTITDTSLRVAHARSPLPAVLMILLAVALVSLGIALMLIGMDVYRFNFQVRAKALTLSRYLRRNRPR